MEEEITNKTWTCPQEPLLHEGAVTITKLCASCLVRSLQKKTGIEWAKKVDNGRQICYCALLKNNYKDREIEVIVW